MSEIKENLEIVRERIRAACRRAGRDESEVTLIAVSKTKPVPMLMEAYEAGAREFGENKVQEWNVWRAPTDNDRNIMRDWINADYHREQSYVYDCTYDVTDTVTIKCHNALIPVVQRKHMDIETVWTIYANGIIDMQSSVKVGENLPVIPRFGLRFFTKGENVKYYGYGPYESYSDKHLCTYLDEFNTTVSDMYEPYIKPQENGSHFGTRYVETENIRVSSDTPFSFSALHYTQEELTEKKHNFELEKCDDTVLCIDYKQNGIGQNSCGPLTQEEYRFDESEFEFKIRIEIK